MLHVQETVSGPKIVKIRAGHQPPHYGSGRPDLAGCPKDTGKRIVNAFFGTVKEADNPLKQRKDSLIDMLSTSCNADASCQYLTSVLGRENNESAIEGETYTNMTLACRGNVYPVYLSSSKSI